MKYDIVIYPDSRLREPCKPVVNINTEIQTLLSDMAETMYEASGIGLAAPQIGSKHRVIVVDVRDDEEEGRKGELLKLINPEIIKSSGKISYEEGCLSIPHLREYVTRKKEITVKAINEKEQEVVFDADGLLAICIQHEIDHLDGILFIDRLSKLKKGLVKPKLRKLEEGLR